jgi:hypothetical protein
LFFYVTAKMLEAIPLGQCAFALSLLLWNGLAKAQYFIGFQAGPIGMLPLGNSGDQVKHLTGYGIGLAAWDRDTVGQGNFRFGLEWVQRSYNMDLFTSSGGDETHRKPLAPWIKRGYTCRRACASDAQCWD